MHFKHIEKAAMKLGSDNNAHQFTTILKSILDDLNDVACQVVHTTDEGLAVTEAIYEASLTAAGDVEPLCGDDVELMMLVKDRIQAGVMVLQLGRKHDRKGVKPDPFSDEEVQRVRDELNGVRARYSEFQLAKEDQKVEHEQ